MSVPRGTTPIFTLTFPQSAEIDLTQASHVYVTFTWPGGSITKADDALTINTRSIGVILSQEETLSFAEGPIDLQANWTTAENKRLASEVVRYQIGRQLLMKVIE